MDFLNSDDIEDALRTDRISARELYCIWEQRQPVPESGGKRSRARGEAGRVPWLQENMALARLFTARCLAKEEFLLVCEAAAEILRLWPLATDSEKHGLVRVRMDYAQALTRLGFTRRAREELEPCTAEDFQPVLGRKLRADIFLRLGDILREESHHAVADAATVHAGQQALEFYRAALRLEPERLEALLSTAAISFTLAQPGDRLAEEAQAMAVRIGDLLSTLEETEGSTVGNIWSSAVVNTILGRFDEARAAYVRLSAFEGVTTADLAEARHRAQFLAEAGHKPRNFFQSSFPPLELVVFSGHLPDLTGKKGRFPPELIETVKARISAKVKEAGIRVGVVSAAAGADLLFIEALRAQGKPIHVILPWAKEEFRKTSVRPYESDPNLPAWEPLFDAAIEHATTIREIGQPYEPSSSLSWNYTMEVTAGIALHTARTLRLDVLPMALWDGQPGRGAGGTNSFVNFWSDQMRHPPVIISMPLPPDAPDLKTRAAPLNPARAERATLRQEVKSMLFADIVGYSKLTEHVIPEFIETFLVRVSELASSSRYAPRCINTWGDAIYGVFDFAHDAGCFALELTQMIQEGEKDWIAKGLYWEPAANAPAKPTRQTLSIRIGLHSGPVFMHYNPVVRQLGFTGTHVNRAARIEPVAKPGEVFASEEFAALAEIGAEIRRQQGDHCRPGHLDFVCEYAGSMALAKGYPGLFRIYRVIPKRVFVLEELAEAAHDGYCAEARTRGERPETNSSIRPWSELPHDFKEANRAQVADIPNKLRLLGYELAPGFGLPPSEMNFSDAQIEDLSIREHDRWMEDRQMHGWTYAPERDNARKKHPLIVPWEDLSEPEREKDRDTIRNLPRLIEKAGFRVRKCA